MEELARALPRCEALKHLDLSCNKITDQGAKSLAEVLGECGALAHLDLKQNLFTRLSAQILIDANTNIHNIHNKYWLYS